MNKNQLTMHRNYVHKVEDSLHCNLCETPFPNMAYLRQHTLLCITEQDFNVMAGHDDTRIPVKDVPQKKEDSFHTDAIPGVEERSIKIKREDEVKYSIEKHFVSSRNMDMKTNLAVTNEIITEINSVKG